MHVLLVSLLVAVFVPAIATAQDDPLSRRADLGAAIRPPTATAPARVVRITESSALHHAGLRAGDDLLALDGHRFVDAIDFDRRIVRMTAFPQYRVGHWWEGGRNPYYLENVAYAFGQPGEWFADPRTRRLRYTPTAEESGLDPASHCIAASALSTRRVRLIVTIAGRSASP